MKTSVTFWQNLERHFNDVHDIYLEWLDVRVGEEMNFKLVAQIEYFLAEWAAVLVGLVVNVGYVLLQLVPVGEHLSTDVAHHLLWLRRLRAGH